ncbi:MATE family efflux transporter [Lacrimispora amygdalina]|uniref:Probable multidrug resistance protein NorM n=1 Tax=Lacrimispora amygdalina TaxID=253257 RepID=A0A3E2NFD6_9FIRM|nr:MATE family efflux transporter [Clostridium indicum]RFZ79706.1 MATE family efflux transporter [Clostridium indicum]
MEKNLTTGSVFKTVLYFSLPYLLSYFLQTLYGMADLFIIGQFNGVDSITAVSIASQVMHMVTVMLVGLAMGATVMIGRCVGAGDHEQTSAAIGNTITLFMALSVMIMIVLLMAVNPIAAIMLTPAEAYSETVTYLTICMIGIPFITGYNIISSVFRGMGDSKSPMCFIAVACVANIVLDYLFIGILKLGAAGAALGTTLSQTISVIVSLVFIKKRNMVSLSLKDLKPQIAVMQNILKVGIPVALQDGFIQIAFIVIAVIANSRGLNDAAAVGIVEKIIGILFLVPSSMLSTVSVLSAQNAGADKHERARQTLWIGIITAVSFGTISAVMMQLLAEPAIGLFTDNSKVILLGGQYMSSYVWDCIFAGIHFCFSGYFCAYGLSGISFIHNLVSIICARIPLAYLASVYFADTLYPMGIAAPAGSVLSVIICVSVFIWMSKHPDKLTGRL